MMKQNNEKRVIKRLLHACVREQLFPHAIEGNSLIVSLTRSKQMLVANKVQHFNLGKFKIDGEVMVISSESFRFLHQIDDLLALIHHELNDVEPAQWKKFEAEILNCNANETLVTEFIQQFNRMLAKKIAKTSAKTFIEYMTAQHSAIEQLMFFEAWATKGHPYHPCHKTKLGFSPHAYSKFSPEFNEDIHLPVAAIAQSIVQVKSECDHLHYHHWFAQQYPQVWHAWCDKLHARGLSEATYYPLFIHPWQYENVLIHLFSDEISSNQLILFPDVYAITKASLSFRTLMVKDNHSQPHIKLPVAVHSTSAVRTISPASVHNGPELGKIIRKILSNEPSLNAYLKVAYETWGLHLRHQDPNIAKHLGIIYRDNPANLIANHHTPIVVAAFFEESPITSIPLFIEMLETAVGHHLSGAIEYFDQYCQIVLQAYLDLFLIYGIALEGHQQNTIAVFENYFPAYMIARDFGGLRVHMPTLRLQGFSFDAYPHSATVTEDRQEATNKFLHSVIQYHLGEIALLLAQHYQTSEKIFWKVIKNNIELRLHAVKERMDSLRWQQEYKAILEDDWQIKALMSMRLNNVYNKYININLKNPLRDI